MRARLSAGSACWDLSDHFRACWYWSWNVSESDCTIFVLLSTAALPGRCPQQLAFSNCQLRDVTLTCVSVHEQHQLPAQVTLKSGFVVYTGACKKGCEGPVLRTLQRFGALGRRSNGPKCVDKEAVASAKRSKNAR